MIKVYLRPLRIKDALISYRWRNNPKIWEYTGNKPNKIITIKSEMEWIRNVICKEDEKRFAICLQDSNVYVGNIQLTNIRNEKAEYHIFIGEEKYWGKGIASKATKLLLKFAKEELNIREIYLFVNKNNLTALNLYINNGFVQKNIKNNIIEMINLI